MRNYIPKKVYGSNSWVIIFFPVTLVYVILEWITKTPEKELRRPSTLNYPTLNQSQKQKLMDEFSVTPDAFMRSPKWKPEKTLNRLDKV